MKYTASVAAIAVAMAALTSVAVAQDKPTIAFVVNGPSDFWKLTEAGVATAQAELADVELQFRYPERADAAVQQRVVDDLIAAGVDAIAVSVVDPATSTESTAACVRGRGSCDTTSPMFCLSCSLNSSVASPMSPARSAAQ